MTHLIVAGAGIGGLTAAFALAQAGVEVTVLERRQELGEIGAGLQLAPNATRILDRLGLLADIRNAAVEPQAVRIGRGLNGREIVRLPIGAQARQRYGAPFLVLHRADLQAALLAAVAKTDGISMRLGMTAMSAEQAGRGVSVTTGFNGADGHTTCDGFVDATGIGANTPSDREAADTIAWRALVPASALPARFAEPDTNLWIGPDAHVVHYPIRDRTLVNVVVVTRSAWSAGAVGDVWSQTGDPSALLARLHRWCRPVQTLIAAASAWRCWPLFDRAPAASWTRGAATVLGDAAHPMLPFLAQGASQCIEDAAVLAESIIQRDVPTAFGDYERRRVARATRVQRESRRQGWIYHLARPASDARDLVLRLMSGDRALARMDWLYADQDHRTA